MFATVDHHSANSATALTRTHIIHELRNAASHEAASSLVFNLRSDKLTQINLGKFFSHNTMRFTSVGILFKQLNNSFQHTDGRHLLDGVILQLYSVLILYSIGFSFLLFENRIFNYYQRWSFSHF